MRRSGCSIRCENLKHARLDNYHTNGFANPVRGDAKEVEPESFSRSLIRAQEINVRERHIVSCKQGAEDRRAGGSDNPIKVGGSRSLSENHTRAKDLSFRFSARIGLDKAVEAFR
ncbi:hypothetical protein EV656_1223 [Rhodovulum adriaticum]|uniref:Uncharacterized protein n=1 Tax=Rhodovulum adriaticum TaxID=35804 RepID=A0A4R2NFV3_RHOAD|nr:hypothetical protein EV656_1223 [Rhodovulum adriaticum]